MEFEPNQLGRRPRFCSPECWQAWWNKHRKQAGKQYTFICQHCGREYQTIYQNRNSFCSRECYFAHQQYEKELRAAEREACPIWIRECTECGRLFVARRKSQIVCGQECKLARGRRLWAEYKRVLGRNEGRIEKRTCRECGIEFEQVVHNKLKYFCSKRCARKNWRKSNPEVAARMAAKERHSRRARIKGAIVESIDPQRVFERDGWKCGICGRKVDSSLHFPHPRSVSLDHIQPLALGGMHSYTNVQCAHLICNSRKSGKAGGQYRLPLTMEIVIPGASKS